MASRYLGVAPWDLAAQPAYYQVWALTALAAEGNASKQRELEARGQAQARAQAAAMTAGRVI